MSLRSSVIALFILLSFVAHSQTNSECNEKSRPYWANGINSQVKGGNITIRETFKSIQENEQSITPKNGFITLRLNVSKHGNLCDIETFQIDADYKPIVFNNGKLIEKLYSAATNLTEWKRDKNFKTYNLIRFKIKNGKITEVF